MQKIMESISVGGEAGGAGGAYSYNALKRLDNIWSNICTQPTGNKNNSLLVTIQIIKKYASLGDEC